MSNEQAMNKQTVILVQSSIAVLMTTLLIWIAATVTDQKTEIAVLNTKMDTIHLDITKLDKDSNSYVTIESANEVYSIINHRLDQLNLQVRAVELSTVNTGS